MKEGPQKRALILLAGDRRDVGPVDLDSWFGADDEFEHVENLSAALRRLAAPRSTLPEVIVLVQSRPGQLDDAAIETLRAAAPLARVWRLLGSWCEGEARSGHPPSGCISTLWHQWPARIAQEQAAIAQGRAPLWALPLTASADERGLAVAERPPQRGRGLVAICARQAATAVALADVCRLGGYGTTRLGPASSQARVVLWDAGVDEMAQPAAVERVRSMAPAAAIVAIVGFPRAEDFSRAAQAGVAAVVSKPYSIHDLLWQISRVAAPASD